jgi:4-carboxymuconolactone decarboxylase
MTAGVPCRPWFSRLLVIGATAALGRVDLVEIQVRGALANGELSAGELRVAVLQLQYYVGWGNGTQLNNGAEAALRAHVAETTPMKENH